MRSVYGWMLARLVVVVGLIVFVRVALTWVTVAYVEQLAPGALEMVEGGDLGSTPIDGIVGGGGANTGKGDPGRAGQPIPMDLQQDGQVVMRDGQLVVLLDSTDPRNEVYEPLDPMSARPMPWILREGWGPTIAAVTGGVGLYLVGWALLVTVRLLRGASRARTSPRPPPP